MNSAIKGNESNRWVYGLIKIKEITKLAIESFNTNLFNSDPVIDPEAERLLENPTDRKNIFEAIERMKNDHLKEVEVPLSNNETITLSID